MGSKKKLIQQNKNKNKINQIRWISIIVILAVIVVGAFALIKGKSDTSAVEFMDIHGLGFTKSGTKIYVPAHDGLKVYENGVWKKGDGEGNDYMGFSMVNDGFYSSGHPGTNSSKKNPLGIVKSTDMGKSIDILNLYGEIDFHGLAVGYNTHAIYVINPEMNSKMKDTGLYYSLDDTKTWKKSNMNGIEGQIFALAAHPNNDKVIAISTNKGIFISKDNGNTFNKVLDDPTTAISFSEQGKLIAGSISSQLKLINIETNEAANITIPSLEKDDAIGYIAVNPKNEKHIAFTTFTKNIYISEDQGKNWLKLADEGKGIDIKKEK